MRVVVHGAAGGVGSALLDLGALVSVTLIGTASASKFDLVRQFGATPIDYRSNDVVSRVRTLTGGGVDVVYDGIGGASFTRSYHMLRAHGRLVAYGIGPAVSQSRVPWLALLSMAQLSWLTVIRDGRSTRSYLIDRSKHRDSAQFHADVAAVMDLLRTERIHPVVSARFPLSEASATHTLLETGKSRDKTVLLP